MYRSILSVVANNCWGDLLAGSCSKNGTHTTKLIVGPRSYHLQSQKKEGKWRDQDVRGFDRMSLHCSTRNKGGNFRLLYGGMVSCFVFVRQFVIVAMTANTWQFKCA